MEGLCGKVMAAPSMRVTLLQEREDKCWVYPRSQITVSAYRELPGATGT